MPVLRPLTNFLAPVLSVQRTSLLRTKQELLRPREWRTIPDCVTVSGVVTNSAVLPVASSR
ncbi:hypothetical protein CN200_02470 [Sinorhizobium meliloti]|nr:hypothetical protein Sinme_5301 [Sinorhizobium meliloti AK83]ASP66628.1 hypothetical protein CDO29_18690 [Sinorhizobium meliloti]MBP2470235.1 hypothetical protein [Sinorhizobium meliloti]QGJ76363.1 hypothetical protein C3L21_20255 [Sinorhizobium meliloti]RMC65933.1 hypothetical protein EBB04_18500 [Sinorhizobium meliloti]